MCKSKKSDVFLLITSALIGTPCVVLLGWIVYAVGNPKSAATQALVIVLKAGPF